MRQESGGYPVRTVWILRGESAATSSTYMVALTTAMSPASLRRSGPLPRLPPVCAQMSDSAELSYRTAVPAESSYVIFVVSLLVTRFF